MTLSMILVTGTEANILINRETGSIFQIQTKIPRNRIDVKIVENSMIDESLESEEPDEELKYPRHVVSQGTAVVVKNNKSSTNRLYAWIVDTLLCRWMFKNSVVKVDQILNKHKVRKSKTMKRLKVNTVRHQNSHHLSDVTHSNEVKIKIIENNNTFAPQISNDTMNVNLYIDNLSGIK